MKKYLIVLALATGLTACTNAVGSGVTQTPPDPVNPEPVQPTDPPTQALKGIYTGEMTGKLLGESTYKISIGLNEVSGGKFVYSGPKDPNRNYYQLWDLKQSADTKRTPDYDGFATGERKGSILNLALPINYKDCYLNLKAYVSMDSKTLEFFSTKQTVNCGIDLYIALKPFSMKQK
jgi:hypothetical protein